MIKHLRPNILSIMLVKAWLGPFVLTFVIAQFVLVMQFLWKHIDDLAGKGLEWSIILELLYYASATFVPMALPLAILLSSIMTVGNLAENLEVVAAKAAGIPLLRLLRPLMFTAAITAVLAFLFSNHVMPVANYKFRSLLSAIRSARPAIDITEGVFYNGIRGLTVYVAQKSKEGNAFRDVMIYDHTRDGWGASVLTIAEHGTLKATPDKNFLILTLYNGIRYDDRAYYTEGTDFKIMEETFETQRLFIDISEEKLNRENSYLKSSYQMMSVGQLEEVLDKLEEEKLNYFNNNAYKTIGMHGVFPLQEPVFSPVPEDQFTFLTPPANQEAKILPELAPVPVLVQNLNQEELIALKAKALETLDASRKRYQEMQDYFLAQRRTIASALVEWHRKFTLSFACLVLFFIGAPLGAIIRKGGLGLPLIFCVVIFISYHIISTIGERSAKQLLMDAWAGMWLSSMILLPFGIFLTLRVSTDSRWFSLETYQNFFRKMFSLFRRSS